MAEPALDDLDLVIKTMARTIVDNADYFAQLDSIVGDGDFGYSLRNGFEVVHADYDSWDKPTTGAVLKKIGVTMAGKVGGVSGPIWGTAFLRAGVSAGEKTELGPDDVIALLRAAIGGIKQRGESDLGDKTLLDALVPAVDSLEASFADRRRSRSRRGPACGRRRGQGGRGHGADDRQAGPRGLHRRTQHRLRRRRRHGRRRHLPGHQRRVAREVWEVTQEDSA